MYDFLFMILSCPKRFNPGLTHAVTVPKVVGDISPVFILCFEDTGERSPTVVPITG